MPYIKANERFAVDNERQAFTAGELNYRITSDINDYILLSGGVNYNRINEVIGVLECAKLELYRRIAAPYEDKKKNENGDVYTV
jgi:hypothetical protein